MSILLVIFGVLLTLSGFSSMFNPVASAFSTGIFLGVFMGTLFIVNGINALTFDIRLDRRFWKFVIDILTIILGIVIIFSETGVFKTSNFLIICMGIGILIAGASRIIVAFQIRQLVRGWGWILAAGIISVIAGIFIIIDPMTGLFAFDFMLSMMAVVMGINMITIGIRTI